MSTGRTILFLAKKKTPMVKQIGKALKEINTELYPKEKPRVIKRGQYKSMKAQKSYIYGAWFYPDGSNFEDFGSDEIFEKKHKEYNKKYKVWAFMGGNNTTYTDSETGETSCYPINYFKMLMKKLIDSGIENDVLLLTTTDSGGYNHKTYPKKIRSKWTGKFL